MSTTTTKPDGTDMAAFEHAFSVRVHIWLSNPPLVGDRALCGVEKVNPYSGRYASRHVDCETCLRLDGVLS